MKSLVQAALDFGFSHAGLLDVATLAVRPEVRDMCAADLCSQYGRCWVCPPGCGTLDDSRKLLAGFKAGLLVQTTVVLEDEYDYEAMLAAGEEHRRLVADFRHELWPRFPKLVALGNGACTICDPCTYPDAPCRYPELAVQSMEALGLVVSDVCAANDLPYYHGPGTLTYTGCYLLI
ncbi:MAG: DUF2284 domain-containing protein [Propionibacteriaceae bacterium]|nr:DUF2284 domain-containing protein [Propionibacteriaceae bacterium]